MQNKVSDSKFGGARFDDLVDFVNEVRRINHDGENLPNNDQKKIKRSIDRLTKALTGTNNNGTSIQLINYRSGMSPVVTTLGEQMYEEADKLVALLKRWRRQVRQHHRGIELRIGFRGFHWRSLIQPWTEKILEESGNNLSLDFVTGYPEDLERKLRKKQLHFALVYDGFGDMPGYESTRLNDQHLFLAAHIPDSDAPSPASLDEIINGNDAYYAIKVERDASSFDRQYQNYHDEHPFFSFPKHRFRDTNIAWEFFKSEAGRGALGYFSARKLRQVMAPKHNIKILNEYCIKRPLILYKKTYKVESASEKMPNILDMIRLNRLPSEQVPCTDMYSLMEACQACLLSVLNQAD